MKKSVDRGNAQPFSAGVAAGLNVPKDQLTDAVGYAFGFLDAVSDRADEETRFFLQRCKLCKWKGLSCQCSGGKAIADTGDFDELRCPLCGCMTEDMT